MVGILLSYWGGLFSGAMLVLGRVPRGSWWYLNPWGALRIIDCQSKICWTNIFKLLNNIKISTHPPPPKNTQQKKPPLTKKHKQNVSPHPGSHPHSPVRPSLRCSLPYGADATDGVCPMRSQGEEIHWGKTWVHWGGFWRKEMFEVNLCIHIDNIYIYDKLYVCNIWCTWDINDVYEIYIYDGRIQVGEWSDQPALVVTRLLWESSNKPIVSD